MERERPGRGLRAYLKREKDLSFKKVNLLINGAYRINCIRPMEQCIAPF